MRLDLIQINLDAKDINKDLVDLKVFACLELIKVLMSRLEKGPHLLSNSALE
jgi:hypothetical protein